VTVLGVVFDVRLHEPCRRQVHLLTPEEQHGRSSTVRSTPPHTTWCQRGHCAWSFEPKAAGWSLHIARTVNVSGWRTR
jgi:hypothetical protein